MSGHIYCAIIDCYPDYVKVGCTTNIHNRMNNLSASSHMDKFKCIFSIEVEQLNMYSIEKNIHQDIINAGFKRFKGREFFNCKPNDIKYIFNKYNNKLIQNNIIEEKIAINKIHLEINQNMKYNCELCNFESNKKTNYEIHLHTKTHISKITPKDKFCCNRCLKIFNYNNSLYRHQKTCHTQKNNDNIINNDNNIDPKTEVLLLKQKVKFLEEKAELESKLIKEKAELESKLIKEKAELESKLIKEKAESKLVKEKTEKELLKEFQKEKTKL
jgi:hypothetical protein